MTYTISKIKTKELRHFLSGGGEMGELIRTTDWSQTPIGDPDRWSQSLKTMVSVMLDNPFGMYIAWGKEYTQIYNDGFRPILGITKHPQALGISSRETFSEIWHIIETMFDDVMKGIPVGFPDFHVSLNRNGYLEDCYFNFSYSPIRKENGKVGGVLVTVIETTNKKKAEDELKASKALLEFAIEAADMATWDYNPVSNKFSANNRLKEWFGLLFDDEIDIDYAINLIAIHDRERVKKAIETALDYTSGGEYDIEYTINHPVTFVPKIVRAKGKASFGSDKIAYRFNGILQDVSKDAAYRKKMEESVEHLRLAVESAKLGTFELDLVTHTHIFSEKLFEIFGLDPAKTWDHWDLKEALHPDDVFIRNKAHEKSFITGSLLYEARIILKDGSVHWIRTRGKIKYENNVPVRLYGIVLDITEEKEAEKKLKMAKEQLEIIFQNVPAGVQLRNNLGELLYANDAAAKMTGYASAREMIRERDIDTIKKRVLDNFDIFEEDESPFKIENTPVMIALKTGKSTENMYYTVNKKTGITNWYMAKAAALLDEAGNVSLVVSTNTDITLQKNDEKLVKEKEAMYRGLVYSLPSAIYTCNAEGYIELYNEAAAKLWGRRPEIGKELWCGSMEIFRTDGSPLPLEECPMAIALKEGRSINMEIIIKRPDGSIRYVIPHPQPQFNSKGEITGALNTLIDITEQKLKEQKKDEFIGIASHEMKTPLTSAKGYIELLLLSLEKGNNTHYLYADKANQSIERLQSLITELLDASKIQNGKLNYNYTTFDLDEMVNETIQNIQHTAKNHHLVKSGNYNYLISGDRERLQQVLINLINNAVKYSPDADEVLINIEEGNNNSIQISIQDFGVGISPDYLNKIFDRYYRVDEDSIHFQGLGIGLYICHEIINRHNGKIWAESARSNGSTFYFTLPI